MLISFKQALLTSSPQQLKGASLLGQAQEKYEKENYELCSSEHSFGQGFFPVVVFLLQDLELLGQKGHIVLKSQMGEFSILMMQSHLILMMQSSSSEHLMQPDRLAPKVHVSGFMVTGNDDCG